MLKGLKDRIVNISSSAIRIATKGIVKNKNSFYCSKSVSKFRKIAITTMAAAAITVTAIAGIGASLGTTVTIQDGANAVKEVTTHERYVEGILSAEGIVLGAKDRINILPKTPLEDGMKIEIERAYKVTVTDKGVPKEHMTLATTVDALLKEYGYQYKDTDKITPAPTSPISSNSGITIIRTEERTETISEEIPFRSSERNNASLEAGKTNVVQEGKPGKKNIVYKIHLEDGIEVSREKIGEEVVVASVDKITEIGTKKIKPAAKKGSSSAVLATTAGVTTSRSGNLAYSKVMTLNATGYSASTCGKAPSHPGYGITATGAKAVRGIVAVDPRVIPLGSKLYIETPDGSYIYGSAVAADTGGAIKGNRIDLCFNSRQDALNFGRRQVKVYVLK